MNIRTNDLEVIKNENISNFFKNEIEKEKDYIKRIIGDEISELLNEKEQKLSHVIINPADTIYKKIVNNDKIINIKTPNSSKYFCSKNRINITEKGLTSENWMYIKQYKEFDIHTYHHELFHIFSSIDNSNNNNDKVTIGDGIGYGTYDLNGNDIDINYYKFINEGITESLALDMDYGNVLGNDYTFNVILAKLLIGPNIKKSELIKTYFSQNPFSIKKYEEHFNKNNNLGINFQEFNIESAISDFEKYKQLICGAINYRINISKDKKQLEEEYRYINEIIKLIKNNKFIYPYLETEDDKDFFLNGRLEKIINKIVEEKELISFNDEKNIK